MTAEERLRTLAKAMALRDRLRAETTGARLPAPRVPRQVPPRPAPTRAPGLGIGAEAPARRSWSSFEVHPLVLIFAALAAGYCLGLARANWLIESILTRP